MNYKKIYESLIERGKNRKLSGYKESHHIIPKCVGGKDNKSNLVDLTPEEHYLAHQLLTKVYPNEPKLVYAAQMMVYNRPSNKLYGWIKRKFSKEVSINQSGKGNSQYGTKWICNLGTKENRKINVGDKLPKGFIEGRSLWKKTYKERLKEQTKLNKEIRINEKIKYAEELYKIFLDNNFKSLNEFSKSEFYPYSCKSLSNLWRTYLPNYENKSKQGKMFSKIDMAT